MTVTLSLSVPVFSTENIKKIEESIENLLGEIPEYKINQLNNHKLLEAENLSVKGIEKFFNYIREAEILDAIRKCAVIDFNQRGVLLHFHKQALYVGRFAVITSDTSSPLGDFQLLIKGADPEKILDWLAPETFEGNEKRKRKFSEITSL